MFENLKRRLEGVFDGLRGRGKLTEEDITTALREVRRALLEADVNLSVAKDFVARVKEKALGTEVLNSITPANQVIAIVHDELVAMMGGGRANITISPKPPTKILMVGLQGSGKTTSAAKLALKLKESHKPMVVACDLQRPAAVSQLKSLASRADVGFWGPEEASITDVVALAESAEAQAARTLKDVIIYDTAGRLAIDEALMDELKRLKGTLSPTEILLVVDSMAGQEALSVAQAFHEALGITGLVLTKMDGDSRGGAALAVLSATGVPVKFAGVGEGIEAFELFDASRMAGRIMGMGDLAGLAEKVRNAASEEDLMAMAKSLGDSKKKGFSLNDMLRQFEQMEKLGPLEDVMDMLPGGLGKKFGELPDDVKDPKRLKRMKAIIQSMTPQERANPKVMNARRRRRVALGSGTTVQMVNQLLKQHDQMNTLMKRMGLFGKGSMMARSLRHLFK